MKIKDIKDIKEITEIFDERKTEGIKWEDKYYKTSSYLSNYMLLVLRDQENRLSYFHGKPTGTTNMNGTLLFLSQPYDPLMQSVNFRDIVAAYALPGLESRLEPQNQEQIEKPAFLRKIMD